MRHLIVPTCLFISAWAHPAGPMFEYIPNATDNVSVIEKNRLAAVNDGPIVALPPGESGPAETTEQLTSFDVNDDPSASDESPAQQNREASIPQGDFDEAGFRAADFDAPVPGDPLVPLPPRRAIPHRLVCEALADAAVDNDLPTPFLIRLIWQESGFNQNAVSPVGAQGVAQFMPATAARMQLDDPFNPLQAVRASAQLLRDLFKQFGNLGLAAAAYNAGPKRVQDWLAKRGKLPDETRNYVQRITGVTPEHWKTQPTAPAIHVARQVPCQREAGLLAADGPRLIPLPPMSPAMVAALEAEKARQIATAKAREAVAAAKKKADEAKTKLAAATEDTPAPAAEPAKTTKTTAKTTTKTPAKVSTKAAAKKTPVKTAAADKPAPAKTAPIKTAPAKAAPTSTLAAKQRTKPGKGKKVEVASAHK
jgi:hypothetical protein